MAVPLDIETVSSDPVQGCEGTIEFLIHRLGETGTVALDETISCATPLAINIDRIVEFSWLDDGQKTGLQNFVNKSLTGGRDGHLFCL